MHSPLGYIIYSLHVHCTCDHYTVLHHRGVYYQGTYNVFVRGSGQRGEEDLILSMTSVVWFLKEMEPLEVFFFFFFGVLFYLQCTCRSSVLQHLTFVGIYYNNNNIL